MYRSPLTPVIPKVANVTFVELKFASNGYVANVIQFPLESLYSTVKGVVFFALREDVPSANLNPNISVPVGASSVT